MELIDRRKLVSDFWKGVEDCFYCRKGNRYRYCAYLMETEKRRPCPTGEGCTVKVPRKVYRKKAKY
jgi:hypothetical protein